MPDPSKQTITRSDFSKSVKMRIILPYNLIIYKTPRLLFKNMLGCILMKLQYMHKREA